MKNLIKTGIFVAFAALALNSFAQQYPTEITGNVDWNVINGSGTYTEFQLNGGTIKVPDNTINSDKSIEVLAGGGTIDLANSFFFNIENFSISGNGNLSVTNADYAGFIASSLNMGTNTLLSVNTLTIDTASVQVLDGKLQMGSSSSLVLQNAGSINIGGTFALDLDSFNAANGGLDSNVWTLASLDSTSFLTWEDRTIVQSSDGDGFQLVSSSDYTYVYKYTNGNEEWVLTAVDGNFTAGVGSLSLSYTLIPEPSQYAAAFGLLAAFTALYRRKKN